MKIAIKIFMLLLAVMAVVAGFIFFMKTKMEPPSEPRFVNEFLPDCKAVLRNYKNNKSNYEADYWAIKDLINYEYSLHKFVGDPQKSEEELHSEMLMFLANEYFPLFKDYCYKEIFSSSDWTDEKLAWINLRIDDITTITNSNLTIEQTNCFREMRGLMEKFKDAWALTRFTSDDFDVIKQKINEANAYQNNNYLQNCTALMNKLDQLPSTLSQSNYNALILKVNKLRDFNCKQYGESRLDDEYENVLEDINKYYVDGREVYGNNLKGSNEEVRRRAQNNYKYAQSYCE